MNPTQMGEPTMHSSTATPMVIEHCMDRGPVTGIVEPTSVPGLVVAPRVERTLGGSQWRFTGRWSVVHAASGKLVFRAPDASLGQARELAEMLGEYDLDWTRTGQEIVDDDAARKAADEVARLAYDALEQGRPIRLVASSWRQCPPPWLVTALNREQEVLDGYFCSNYPDAERMAIELAGDLKLDVATADKPWLIAGWDVTVSRSEEPVWELGCAVEGCPEVLVDGEYDGPVRHTGRAWLSEIATADYWLALDERRWLCPECRDLYPLAGRN